MSRRALHRRGLLSVKTLTAVRPSLAAVRQLPFGRTPLRMWGYVTDNTEVDRI